MLLVEPLRVPELHDPVAARRSQVLALAAKDHSADFPAVEIERADLPAGPGNPLRLRRGNLPDLHLSIEGSRNQVAAIGGAERHGGVRRADCSPCGREREDFPFGLRVPDPNGIDTRRSDAVVFGVPGHTEDNTVAAADPYVVA